MRGVRIRRIGNSFFAWAAMNKLECKTSIISRVIRAIIQASGQRHHFGNIMNSKRPSYRLGRKRIANIMTNNGAHHKTRDNNPGHTSPITVPFGAFIIVAPTPALTPKVLIPQGLWPQFAETGKIKC